MKTSIRRELAWLCIPLVLMIITGAYISAKQNERKAEQKRRESGPLRVRVWGVQAMPVINNSELRAGYNYCLRIDGHIEGVPRPLPPGEVWILRAKSARIHDGKTSRKARVVIDIDPTPSENVPRTDVLAISGVATDAREVEMWIYCDSALANPRLDLELEAVTGTVVPRPGKPYLRTFTATTTRLAVSVPQVPLRKWSDSGFDSDGNSNIVKSEY